MNEADVFSPKNVVTKIVSWEGTTLNSLHYQNMFLNQNEPTLPNGRSLNPAGRVKVLSREIRKCLYVKKPF